MENPVLAYVQPEAGFVLDCRKSGISAAQLAELAPACAAAHAGMLAIERGEIRNLDEYRAVTHFSDRRAYAASALSADVEDFFRKVRTGAILGSTGKPFDAVVVNGIGGSALGPQLLQYAVRGPVWNEMSRSQRQGAARIYFTDNTDSAGLADLLPVLDLEQTLVVTISKSGGTRETLNNQVAFQNAYAAKGLNFAAHAAAVTMPRSDLDKRARDGKWLKVWPMAESIGGRTSETAVVGHVPAAAAGIDFGKLLAGACQMDEWTRASAVTANPAYLLAVTWYLLGNGRGERDMVIVPYSDRLLLMSRYLQQLVMESLGKERDRQGRIVNQGLVVYGNKGGTDAHAFIQQLNDGPDNFFITFIEVLKDSAQLDMGDGMTMGDYLHNFLQGLNNALAAKGRKIVAITLDDLDETAVGRLIALYERAVAYYAELVDINAFHQPGVEAYKKISSHINKIGRSVQGFIAGNAGFKGTAADMAGALGCAGLEAEVSGVLDKFAVNQRVFSGHSVRRSWRDGAWRYEVQ